MCIFLSFWWNFEIYNYFENFIIADLFFFLLLFLKSFFIYDDIIEQEKSPSVDFKISPSLVFKTIHCIILQFSSKRLKKSPSPPLLRFTHKKSSYYESRKFRRRRIFLIFSVVSVCVFKEREKTILIDNDEGNNKNNSTIFMLKYFFLLKNHNLISSQLLEIFLIKA